MNAKPHVTKSPAWSRRPSFAPRQRLTAEQLNEALDDELGRQRAAQPSGPGHGSRLRLRAEGRRQRATRCHRRMHPPRLRPGPRSPRADAALGRRTDRDERHRRPATDRGGVVHALGPPRRAARPTPGLPSLLERRTAVDRAGGGLHPPPGCRRIDRDCEHHPYGSCLSHDDYLVQRTGDDRWPGPGEGRPCCEAVGEDEEGRDDDSCGCGRPPDGLGVEVSDGIPHHLERSDDLEHVCAQPGPLCHTDHDDWLYDPAHDNAVPLACVYICDLANDHRHEAGGSPAQEHPDDDDRCEPRYGFCPGCAFLTSPVRSMVYRNPLLYELTGGCDVDLPRIRDVSWRSWIDRRWDDRVTWREFESRVGYQPGNRNDDTDEGLTITFSKPMRVHSIHPGSVVLTVSYRPVVYFAPGGEERGYYWTSQQVAIAVEPIGRTENGCATTFRILPDDEWIREEVRRRGSSQLFSGARVEITVRGQLVRDHCDQMLDARPLDIAPQARGQGRPGGDFVSTFRVDRRVDDAVAAPDQATQSTRSES